MIRVSLSYLIVFYLGLLLGPIFCAWIFHEWRRQRRERAAFRKVIRCGICAFDFVDDSTTLLTRCPRCANLNERFEITQL